MDYYWFPSPYVSFKSYTKVMNKWNIIPHLLLKSVQLLVKLPILDLTIFIRNTLNQNHAATLSFLLSLHTVAVSQQTYAVETNQPQHHTSWKSTNMSCVIKSELIQILIRLTIFVSTILFIRRLLQSWNINGSVRC